MTVGLAFNLTSYVFCCFNYSQFVFVRVSFMLSPPNSVCKSFMFWCCMSAAFVCLLVGIDLGTTIYCESLEQSR